jgi:hypothetical protein
LDVLLELLKLILVGLVAGLFSAKMAVDTFRSQKWWELKLAAYQEIINVFINLRDYYDSHLESVVMSEDISEDKLKKMHDVWEESQRTLQRVHNSGTFLLSDSVEEAIKNFYKRKAKKHDSLFEEIENDYDAAKECLNVLVLCSKKDLKIEQNFFSRFFG